MNKETIPHEFCNKLRAYTKAIKPQNLWKISDEQIAWLFKNFDITPKRQNIYNQ